MIDFNELTPHARALLAQRAAPGVYKKEIEVLDQELGRLKDNCAAQEMSPKTLASPRFVNMQAAKPYAALMALAVNPDLWITLGAAFGPCDANPVESGVEAAVYVFETPSLWIWAKARRLEELTAPNWRVALKAEASAMGAGVDLCAEPGSSEQIASFFERLCATLVLAGAPECEGVMESVGYVRPALEALVLEMAVGGDSGSAAPSGPKASSL